MGMVGVAAVFTLCATITLYSTRSLWLNAIHRVLGTTDNFCQGVEGLIGNTPMIKLQALSDLTGCTILAKAEYLVLSYSVKKLSN
jgi:hypothetical protein